MITTYMEAYWNAELNEELAKHVLDAEIEVALAALVPLYDGS